MALVIQIRDSKTAFAPGDTVAGNVSWQVDSTPKNAELRLLWATSGRGIEDVNIVETLPFPNPQATETRPFSFTLPEGPYSFAGTLITLKWQLELAIDPRDQVEQVEITVAPEGKAVRLPRV